ncbi:MAG TPA: alpha/beta fold hydrolase [Herpetosiphonaceae bacterium]
MDVVLLHGQGRTPLSMALLGRRLRLSGHAVQSFGYAVFAESFDRIAGRLVELADARPASRPYVIVGHSLGGIITRAALPRLARPPAHLVMLGPPNQPPLLARKLRDNPAYRLLTADCGARLASPDFYRDLPLPTVPTTIIAGTAGPRGRWSPFGDQINDGVVALDETRLTPEFPVITVPALHTWIMNHGAVWRRIEEIL